MSSHEIYTNPLTTRYASLAMRKLFGEQRRISTWRRLWVALAESEAELGLPITQQQIAGLRAQVDNIDFAKAAQYEKEVRHDVMAHVHTFGDLVPEAKGIIHLGATSCYVTDNAELILIREGLEIISQLLITTMKNLATFARQYRSLPTLGFTHFQPAQLTTVGKRACLWLHDLILDLEEVEHRKATLKMRGVKGTTGTQASFLSLFDGDHAKVRELDRLVAKKMGFDSTYPVTSQTYTRKVDSQILDALSGICQSASKFATDIRLLAHRKEMEEPFEEKQIGSSAMAYKRNPMRSERICGLARYVMSLVENTAHTQATQWLERTLDDSSNRRLSIPQGFLGTDAVLSLYANVSNGLVVYPKSIERAVNQELPFMATENIIMAGVRAGGDRQELHEIIRVRSHEAAAQVKKEGLPNDLLERLKGEPAFEAMDLTAMLNPSDYVGRAPQQVEEFLAEVVEPKLESYQNVTTVEPTIEV